MEAGETGSAILCILAAVALAVAFSTGTIGFRHPVTVGGQLDIQRKISWFIGALDGSSWSEEGGMSLTDVYKLLVWVRGEVIAPVLQVVVWACLVMSVMLFVEALYNFIVSLGLNAMGWGPEWRFKWEPMADDDKEEKKTTAHYPMVMVQIPMYNELEVYKLSIRAACELKWPKDKVIVQVLDDSSDPHIKNLVELECENWVSKGVNIKYSARKSREGFKAGALKEGMEHDYAKQCEYVAMFDADFQPEQDFLLRTIPFFLHNPEVALVQARWAFVNDTTNLLTRIQKMFTDYHFKVEQEVGSAAFAFFCFNGSAGVWRAAAIKEVGGWKDRTTVEDMDLAVRATLKGWKFVYAGDIRVKSELPSTYKAYCRQQIRWYSGSTHLFRIVAEDILAAKDVSVLKKFYMIYSFFWVRRVVYPLVTCILYNIILPLSVMIPELVLPVWAITYIPMVLTIITAIKQPKNLHILPVGILFDTVMVMHRMRAALAGLLKLPEINEWVVTKKVGNNFEDNEVLWPKKSRKTLRDRVNFPEIIFSAFLFFCASYNIVFPGKTSCHFSLYLQGLAFLFLGLNFT